MSVLPEVPCICVRVYILVLEVALGLAHAGRVLMLCPHMLVFYFPGSESFTGVLPSYIEITASR